MTDSKKLLKKWIEAFQSREVEAVVDCYAEDAVNFQIAAGDPAVGIKQIRRDTAEFFKGFPDAWSTVENLIGDGDVAAWEWIGGGTFLGEFYGQKPTGKSFEIRGCGFFNFRDEKIFLQRGYWDKLSWYAQIGLKIE
ncbi:MAG: ester cyclase [Pyrinomonadaceae bacterium]